MALIYNPLGKNVSLERLQPKNHLHKNLQFALDASMYMSCSMSLAKGNRGWSAVSALLSKALLENMSADIDYGEAPQGHIPAKRWVSTLQQLMDDLLSDTDWHKVRPQGCEFTTDVRPLLSRVINTLTSNYSDEDYFNATAFAEMLFEVEGRGELTTSLAYACRDAVTFNYLTSAVAMDALNGLDKPSDKTHAAYIEELGATGSLIVRQFMSVMVDLYSYRGELTMGEVWGKFTARYDKAKLVMDGVDRNHYDTPRERMLARMSATESIRKKDTYLDPHSTEVILKLRAILRRFAPEMNEDKAIYYYKHLVVKACEKLKDYKLMSFSTEDLGSVLADGGCVYNLWDKHYGDTDFSGGTWHSDFTDIPMEARATTDMRVFGEIGDYTTYAALIDSKDKESIATLKSMYGLNVLTLDKNLIRGYSTISMNDSTMSPFVHVLDDYTELSHVICKMSDSAEFEVISPFVKLCFLGRITSCDFIEVQIHDRVKEMHLI